MTSTNTSQGPGRIIAGVMLVAAAASVAGLLGPAAPAHAATDAYVAVAVGLINDAPPVTTVGGLSIAADQNSAYQGALTDCVSKGGHQCVVEAVKQNGCAAAASNDFLASLREALPNVNLQMLLRGRNTVGYTPYPTEVTDAFVREAANDRSRHLPHLRRPERRRADAPRHRRRCSRRGTTVAEVAVCYTGDLLDPAEDLYTLDYYLRLAEQIVGGGRPRARDQGHGRPAARPAAARNWSRPSARTSTCPCTCTRTTPRAASSRPCWRRSRAGADAVDVASAPMAGTT